MVNECWKWSTHRKLNTYDQGVTRWTHFCWIEFVSELAWWALWCINGVRTAHFRRLCTAAGRLRRWISLGRSGLGIVYSAVLKEESYYARRDAEIRVSRVGARRLQVPEIVLGSLTRIWYKAAFINARISVFQSAHCFQTDHQGSRSMYHDSRVIYIFIDIGSCKLGS